MQTASAHPRTLLFACAHLHARQQRLREEGGRIDVEGKERGGSGDSGEGEIEIYKGERRGWIDRCAAHALFRRAQGTVAKIAPRTAAR